MNLSDVSVVFICIGSDIAGAQAFNLNYFERFPVAYCLTCMHTHTSSETAQSENAFAVWMKKVDAACEARFGISIHDLPDFCFRDAFDCGDSPARVALAAIRNARDY